MWNKRLNSTVAMSIALMGFAMYGCSGGGNSPASNNKPATPPAGSPPAATSAQTAQKQAQAMSDQQRALQSQAGSVIAGNWTCNLGPCSTNGTLLVSKDLMGFVQSMSITSPHGNNCKIDLDSAVTVQKVDDNGKIANISAKILGGRETYDGDRDDGTDCFDTVYVNDNKEADLVELAKPISITIVLDRAKGILSVAPADNSKPAEIFVKSN